MSEENKNLEEPEDILAETESTVPEEKKEAPPAPVAAPKKSKAWLWKGLIIILVVLVLYFSFPYLRSFISGLFKKTKGPAQAGIQTGLKKEQGPVKKEILTVVDQDKDGLSDKEEKALGTNPLMVDTDQDGLTDREEVKIYHTDPLNPDTDGDNIKDGEEVKEGTNPKDPTPGAALMNLQEAIQKLK